MIFFPLIFKSGYGTGSGVLSGGLSNVVTIMAYFIGGDNAGNGSNTTIDRFDGVSVRRDSSTVLNTTQRCSAGTITTKIYIFGGSTDSAPYGISSNTIQSYDGITRSTLGSTLIANNQESQTSSVSNVNLLFGGYTAAGSTTSVFLTNIQRWNGTTRSTDATAMPSASSPSTTSTKGSSVIGSNTFLCGLYAGQTDIKRYTGSVISTDAAVLPAYFTTGSQSDLNESAYIHRTATGSVIYKYTGSVVTTESAVFNANAITMSKFNDGLVSTFASGIVQTFDGVTVSTNSATFVSPTKLVTGSISK